MALLCHKCQLPDFAAADGGGDFEIQDTPDGASGGKTDSVAKSPPYCVTVFFQDLDIPDVCLRP
jgi:hypothetical protein